MKKLLLSLSFAVLSAGIVNAQCNYTCSDYKVSSVTYTTFPSGPNITPTFTNPFLGTWADDGDSGPVPIGFNFEYYCNTYSDVYICSNGFITFVPIVWPNQYVHPTTAVPNSSAPDGMVALNMADFDPGAGGSISYTTVGTAPNRMFIVTYSMVPIWNSSSDINTGQIVLYETSNLIEIHTTNASAPGNGTQGIENTNGTIGVPAVFSTSSGTVSANNNGNWYSAATNKAVRFAPYTAAPLGALGGDSTLCQGTVGNYSVPAATGALYYTWTVPGGWTGSSTTTAASFTASSSGTVLVTAEYTCGASPASTMQVIVNPSPVVSLTSLTPAIICSGKTITMTVSGADTYTIMPGNITGTTGQITDMPMVPTTYTLMGTDINGCESLNDPTASVLVLESPTVSVNSGTICEGQTFTMMPTGADSYDFSSPFHEVSPPAGTYSYTVVGTSTNGCVSETAVSHLTVSPTPTVNLTSDRPVMCVKQTVTLTATGADTYAWAHTTVTANSITASPNTHTTFSVTGYSSEGCSSSAKVFVMVDLCIGVAELPGSTSFKIYPNPAAGNVTIESASDEDVTVFDLSGRLVLKQHILQGVNKLDVNSLAPGKYTVKGTQSGSYGSLMIIKE